MTHRITRWWWVRHAPVIGVNGRIYGQDDLDSDCGDETQFKLLANTLPKQAVWLVSHLKRTHQTASAIFAARVAETESAPLIASDLAEQHFGDWQGLTYAELEARRDGAYHRFWHAPATERPPNGESFEDVVNRVAAAMDRITAAHAGQDIVAVVHGGTIRAALAVALGIEPERALGFAVDTCSVTRMDHFAQDASVAATQGANWRIVAVNQHPDALIR
ncbi:MAG: histidine phosphatase family protein [Rhodospirillaceae bacterium]|jgi:alpha-ribazole phosphatase|nr:histidine phosphatase family protein [Rhodospirillaceae bacterium]